MGPSLAGGGWGAGASAHKAFSDPIHILPEGEHVCRGFPAPVTLGKHRRTGSRRQPRPSSAEGQHRPRGETGKRCFAEQTGTGAELAFPRRVSLSRRQLPEARFVPFLRWALGGSLPSRRRVGCWGHCTQGLFRPHRLLPEGEHLWSWFPAPVTLGQAQVPREREAAQTLLGPRASTGLGAKPASAALLSTHALGLSLLSQGEFPFREGSSQKLVLCPF